MRIIRSRNGIFTLKVPDWLEIRAKHPSLKALIAACEFRRSETMMIDLVDDIPRTNATCHW